MCGPHFCSMKITEDVRAYAAKLGLSEAEALKAGMQEKSKEFVDKGAKIYSEQQGPADRGQGPISGMDITRHENANQSLTVAAGGE